MIGTGDLRFLSRSQPLNVGVTLACLALSKVAGMGVEAVWLMFVSFSASRVAQNLFRVLVAKPPWRQDGVVCDV